MLRGRRLNVSAGVFVGFEQFLGDFEQAEPATVGAVVEYNVSPHVFWCVSARIVTYSHTRTEYTVDTL